MRKLSSIFFGLFFWITFVVSAQKSTIYNVGVQEMGSAISLFKAKQYAAAKLIFEKIKNNSQSEEIQSDCTYYTAICAMRERLPNSGNLMERFVLDYPTSTKKNLGYLELGHFYFQQENFVKALHWYEKVDESYLGANENEKYNFQKGYSFFILKNKKDASSSLDKVLNSSIYGSQAKYYLGFMAYEGDNYKQANQYFDAVSAEGKYKEKMSYYQSDMNFKLGNFEKAIQLGVQALGESTPLEKSELNKIIGESYFNLNEYTKAIPYLRSYKGKNGRWCNTDFYQLGFAYYQQKDFENAVSQFNKIIDGKDLVSQNAYYYLGQSYLNLNKKQEALNAFKNASEMDFEPSLKEESHLNYAKLSYEIGNSYESVPSVMVFFLEKYPENSNKSEIEKLLIDSYISSKNYKEALIILEKNNQPVNKSAYQKVLFYSGLQSFTDGNHPEALRYFEKAINHQHEAYITARAMFWKGETQFVLDDFKNALLSFKQFIGLEQATGTPEFKNCNYNIAYTYFKLKEYNLAENYFQNQIEKSTDKSRMNDSYLRMGDCRFMTSKYWSALQAYGKIMEQQGIDADYAYLHTAICFGFLGKNTKKIEVLNSFLQLFSKSAYRDDVLFELGNTYAIENKQELAIQTYERLISEFPKSSFTSKAILKQGLVFYNSDHDEEALLKFKKVVVDFPKSEEALEAVSTARLIYVEKGKVEEYATWVRTLDFVTVSDADLDNDSYEAAEKQFQQNNTKEAITGFTSYLTAFPKGIHVLQANFYLAQSLYLNGSEEKAIPHYELVIAASRNDFTEPSLMRLAEIFLKNKTTQKAVLILSRIEREADLPQNKTFAQANLMSIYFDKKDYNNAVNYAEKVMTNPKIGSDIEGDAQIIVARSAIKTGDEKKAKVAYEKLKAMARGELAAEALYYEAYFKNKEGKLLESNAVVQQIAKNYSAYRYFGAKSLVLMATNFYGLKDSYQANYILESVIKNFTEFPDVVVAAQKELEVIKAKESLTNSSIKQ